MRRGFDLLVAFKTDIIFLFPLVGVVLFAFVE